MHVLRPPFVFVGMVVVVLTIRSFVVPATFGVHNGDYVYGWYDQSNLATWQSVKVKFQGREYCQGCHAAQFTQLSASLHAAIQCASCHGPAIDHPKNPPKLAVDRGRDLCLRCHADLLATLSGQAAIKGQDPATHNPGIECATCHRPHSPTRGGSN